jgi:hypothetical protein
MRRKKLFFAVALVSLLLGAGTVWWWINSGNHMSQLSFRQSSGDMVAIYGCDGKLALTRTLNPSEKSDQPTQVSWVTVPFKPGSADGQPALQWTNFSYNRNMLDKGVIQSSLVLPIWVVTGLCSIAPGIWFHKKLKLMKKLAG